MFLVGGDDVVDGATEGFVGEIVDALVGVTETRVGVLVGDSVRALEGGLVGNVVVLTVGKPLIDGETVGARDGYGEGALEGRLVGNADGKLLGLSLSVGEIVGKNDGKYVGTVEGRSVGKVEEASVGDGVGKEVFSVVGPKVGLTEVVGIVEGRSVGVAVGSGGTKTTVGLTSPKDVEKGSPVMNVMLTAVPSIAITSPLGGSLMAYQSFETPSRNTSLGSSPVYSNPSNSASDASIDTGLHLSTSVVKSGIPIASTTVVSESIPVGETPMGGQSPSTRRNIKEGFSKSEIEMTISP